ncbi:MAG: DNA phosphorothioation-associated putative methyltransferase [Chromatiaceae bacterium]|nr:MAG: DNA phosphorothioation-associated putative methyltransferase [Chromatiaceae bacterium]
MSSIGKRVGAKSYLHVEALSASDAAIREHARMAADAAGLEPAVDFNLIRLDPTGAELALLHYPGFFDEPFPALADSWRVDFAAGTVSHRTYADSLNPPILHRKELLLPAEHPRRAEFAALTAACEAVGLFDDPRRIGYRRQWQQLMRELGFRLDGHALVPIGNAEDGEAPVDDGDAAEPIADWQAARQRTALSRPGFSAPIQTLARHGLLTPGRTLFDYGCGRGDDVRGLCENGFAAAGWDPYYAPDQPIHGADLVNLGFVINVIEDFDERLEALTRAWSLAGTLLVVSVMLANQNAPRGERFRDGVRTRRGTFQKYFTQAELKAFVGEVLDLEPIPVAPGIVYAFRDQDAEQRFLLNRWRSGRTRLRAPSVQVRERAPRGRPDQREETYQAHQAALERLWALRLELGRRPNQAEVDDELALRDGFGSLNKALRFIEARKEAELGGAALDTLLADAARARQHDLTVYFALNQFARRKPHQHLEPGLKRDIKAFFGDYAAARAAGRALLMQIADTDAVEQACREAAEHGLGWLETVSADANAVEADAGEEREDARWKAGGPGAVSLQLDARLVERLPPLLRVYIGAAAAAYGDYQHADLIKIHIGSGKLTLMRFDDFDGRPLPRMHERVKIKLREQDVEYFAYDAGTEYEPPFLYRKSRFINEEVPRYPDQLAFEEALEGLGLLDFSGYGPPPEVLIRTLARHRWEIAGFELRRARTTPSLDDPCGRFLSFRDLVHCGEIQAATGIENLPEQVDSWNALVELTEQVLDPVIDWFGMIRLTYGFCSPELARAIRARGGGPIDPTRDQHAAHERNRLGNPVCPRLGAAVDFLVEDEDMLEVARWVAANTPFDRLYFYGPDRPIHVSQGPEQSRQVVMLRAGPSGRLVPRQTKLETFLRDSAHDLV